MAGWFRRSGGYENEEVWVLHWNWFWMIFSVDFGILGGGGVGGRASYKVNEERALVML